MNEHLFKLKKDAKTVGYLKIDRGLVCWRTTTLSAALNKTWCTVHNSARIDFDTAHPFVTKDKNGKDVFADDEIKALYLRLENFAPEGITGKVGWRDETLNWVLYHTPNTPECIDLWKLQDIELIESKENE